MPRRKGQKRNSSQTLRPVERPARRRPGGKSEARKYVKPRPDPKELCFATDDDEPLSPMKRTRLSF